MVVMGHVIGPFGIKGWIKVFPGTEAIDGLLAYPTWWIGRDNGGWQEIAVTDSHINDRTLAVKLGECADRTEAALLKGMQIAIPRNRLPDLPKNGDNGYYWSDLMGLTVINLQGDKLGIVSGFIETGANDVLKVEDPTAGEKLIPFIDQVVVNVNLDLCQLVVDWGVDY
jgi:16S rRNA processing protein RimM